MKIIVTGIVAFAIWCFFSAWLYNDVLLPVIQKPVPVLTMPDPQQIAADSLAQIKASMPANLIISFEFNEHKFKPDQQLEASLAPFKAWLDKYPGSQIVVTGHSDLVGTIEYNADLGMKRANVVAKYLESAGVPSPRMIIESKGETEPAADYLTSEGRARNRRTEISIKM